MYLTKDITKRQTKDTELKCRRLWKKNHTKEKKRRSVQNEYSKKSLLKYVLHSMYAMLVILLFSM